MAKIAFLHPQYSPFEAPQEDEEEPLASFYERFKTNLQNCAFDVCDNEDRCTRWDSVYIKGEELTEEQIEEIRTELTDMVLQTSRDTQPHTFQQLITVVINKTDTNKYIIAICSNWLDAIGIIDTKSSEVFIVSKDSILNAPNRIRHRMRSCILDITPENSN